MKTYLCISIWVLASIEYISGGVCNKTLPQNTETEECSYQRQIDVALARQFYKITEIGSPRATSFPIEEIPFLNQTLKSSKTYFKLDEFEERFIETIRAVTSAYGDNVVQAIINKFKDSDLMDVKTHVDITQFANELVKSVQLPQDFSSPGLEPSFTDVITNRRFASDETFVQVFLANLCPFSIRRVTDSENAGYSDEKLRANFNPTFDILNALESEFERELTWTKVLEDRLFYVLHNEEMDDIQNQQDFYHEQIQESTLNEAKSPIAIFVVKDGLLKVLAIQMDHTPESEVVTPEPSSYKWTLAKATVMSMHKQYCDAYIHAGHLHSVGGLFCMAFRRHFSTQHPLYELLKHHCNGTTAHFAISYEEVLLPGGFVDKTHGIGHQGVVFLVKKAFEDRNFGQMDFPKMLERIGFNENNGIGYYPFRNDTELIWEQLREFIDKVVTRFYDSDEDVQKDTELESFASEMTYGGVGNFIGFPSKITTREQLEDVLLSIIWYPILHGIVNYGVVPAFPLGTPIKLYTNTKKDDTFLNLGNLKNIAEYVRIENLLGNFRYNRIMKYHELDIDSRLKEIVKGSYKKFEDIQKTLEDRNAERKKNDRLGMQHIEPKWLPNSMHI